MTNEEFENLNRRLVLLESKEFQTSNSLDELAKRLEKIEKASCCNKEEE